MKTTKHQHVPVSPGALLVAACMASASAVSYGAITNADFTSNPPGLAGWTTAGDASAQTSFLGITKPATSPEAAAISSIIGPAHIVADATFPNTVEAALGLNGGTLSAAGQGQMDQASGIGQSLGFLSAGDQITFKYNFLTAEEQGGGNLSKDFGFYSLNTTGNSTLNILAKASDALTTSFISSGLNRQTGWQTLTIPVSASGTYTLGFGVADGHFNPGADSALGIASISITPVPEPWAWTLVSALALGGLAVARRVRFNHA